MNDKDILKLLEDSGLAAYKERIAPLIFPSLRIGLEPVDDGAVPVGGSKLGGVPDLPPQTEWPSWKQYSMSFIAQIDLSELPQPSPLPERGLLSFFYTVEGMYGDLEFYGDPDTCKVIYTEEAEQRTGLERREQPDKLSPDAVLRPNRLTYEQELCVPASESAYLEDMGLGWGLNQELFEKYWDVFLSQYRERAQKDGWSHRLLGHPDQIQGDMQTACEKMTEWHSYSALPESEARQRLLQEATKWRLLLQIDSEEEKTGMMWGDVGRIYFWIREDDLLSRRFDRVVCEMQCS
ncbi:YwqG family protein [Paenibacillus kobensis]|uniref:YwqG family protein n=1 Tax=Paenibacillus kobensis TaxID=59841 RepID=UPI000FDCA753|nr:YwqG family protein [Paenibacillus kobensis]